MLLKMFEQMSKRVRHFSSFVQSPAYFQFVNEVLELTSLPVTISETIQDLTWPDTLK